MTLGESRGGNRQDSPGKQLQRIAKVARAGGSSVGTPLRVMDERWLTPLPPQLFVEPG